MTIKEFRNILGWLYSAGLKYTPDVSRLDGIAETWYKYFKKVSRPVLLLAMENYIENERDFPALVDLLDYLGALNGYTKWQLEQNFHRDYLIIPEKLQGFIRGVMSPHDWKRAHGSVKDRLIRESLIPAYQKQQRQNVINSKQIEGGK